MVHCLKIFLLLKHYFYFQQFLLDLLENKYIIGYTKEDKTMYIENTINSALKRIALKLGIGIYEDENANGELVKKTDVHTHMLRGTFATRCAEAKIAPVVLKKILGHSDIAVTMKYYVDVDSEFEKSENANVENYLKARDIFGVEFNSDYEYIKSNFNI